MMCEGFGNWEEHRMELVKMGQVDLFESEKTMTSLEFAEVTKQEHKEILRVIRGYREVEAYKTLFESSSYINSCNATQPCFVFKAPGMELLINRMKKYRQAMYGHKARILMDSK